jgi:hypothetical protein
MQNIVLDVENNGQNILPVPYPKEPVPSVADAYSSNRNISANFANNTDFGSAPYPMPLKTDNRTKDDLQYCNFLEPSPRNQMLNVPYEGKKDCPKFTNQPYGKDSCYLMDNKSQGVVGIVCNQPGGSDNANFVRGNQFGVNYPYDFNEREASKKLEYTVEQPVQTVMAMQNPMVVYDKSTFYPEMNYFLRKNKDYLTYPLQQNYTENGLPTYTYPYKTMNPIFDNPDDIGLFEDFNNSGNIPTKKNVFVILCLIFIILFLIFFSR